MKLLYRFFARQTRWLTSSLFRGKFFERPAPDQYQKVFAQLQEAGLNVSYGTYDEKAEQQEVMVIRFHGAYDVILNPIPDVQALEALVRYLDDDPAVDIEEIQKLFENAK
jgi:hypothetical protein